MRIVVFGAAGRTGRRIIEQGIAAGHEMVAVGRRPFDAAGATIVLADIHDPDAVTEAVSGADAIVSAIGVPQRRGTITDYSAGTDTLVRAMQRTDVRRLIVISSALVVPDWRPDHAILFNRVLGPLVARPLGRTTHADQRRMEAAVRASALEWTLVRPSGLFDRNEVGDYTVTPDTSTGLLTSRTDLAHAIVTELKADAYLRRTMAVATTDHAPGILSVLWRESRPR